MRLHPVPSSFALALFTRSVWAKPANNAWEAYLAGDYAKAKLIAAGRLRSQVMPPPRLSWEPFT